MAKKLNMSDLPKLNKINPYMEDNSSENDDVENDIIEEESPIPKLNIKQKSPMNQMTVYCKEKNILKLTKLAKMYGVSRGSLLDSILENFYSTYNNEKKNS